MTAAELLREKLQAAQTRCDRLTEVRRKLPPTASGIRVANAHSRWTRACEARDRLLKQLELEQGRAAFDRTGPCPAAIEVSRETFDELLAIAEVADGA